MSPMNTRRIAEELKKRGLVPKNCRLVEVAMAATGSLVVRYEVFIEAAELGLFADALKAAGESQIEDDERHRLAIEQDRVQ